MDLLGYIISSRPLLNQWLNRDDCTDNDRSIVPTEDMLFDAVFSDVILAKMLRAIPESQHLQMVSKRSGDRTGRTLLHRAAEAGNP